MPELIKPEPTAPNKAMKNFLYITLLYLVLSLLVISCTENAPTPDCMEVEVVGQDCESGWYILKLPESSSGKATGAFIGQLQGGLVTTDNLPEAYRQAGAKVDVALEINGTYSPRCTTITVMYQAVRVIRVCSGSTSP